MRRTAFLVATMVVLSAPLSAQKKFVLSSLEGRSVDLAQYRGQVVVLSFGATWCPPCREEMPVFQKLADRYKERPVVFFWVSIDDPEVSAQQLREFVSRLGVRVPVLRDPEARILQEFKIEGVPVLLIFDQQGQPVGSPHVGFSDPESYAHEVSKILDSLLNKP